MNINLSNIKKAVKYLNKNECIGIPTETVYGLAANAYSDKATDKIFKLKKRPRKNPLIVHYYNLKDLKNDCNIDNQFLFLYSIALLIQQLYVGRFLCNRDLKSYPT